MKLVCLQASNFAPKMGRLRSAWQLARISSSVAMRAALTAKERPRTSHMGVPANSQAHLVVIPCPAIIYTLDVLVC